MTEHNHRRGTKRQRNVGLDHKLRNAYPPRAKRVDESEPGVYPYESRPWGYPDHSLHGAGEIGELSGVAVGASIGNDFTNGHRGEAKAIRGAKKFVRSRIRFHENAATKKLASDPENE